MKLFGFLKSKAFFISLIAAVVMLVAGVFLALKWLEKTTNHGQRIAVPSILKLDTDQAIQVLEKNSLRMVVLDTVDYDRDFPPLTILEQDPEPNTDVKENRKIYVKINAAGYGKVILPEFEKLTYRQVLATIKSLGLKEGTISYETFIGKDVVLRVTQNGKVLKKGDKVSKNSRVDFVLGDGRAAYTQEELDVAPEID
ncbi:PASTA domain-containing protein [Myroides phaeus]|uniref:PASTA domain-containing protein n=1 Tax=Myroides phaeus TaxID=702745 RepID=UPI0013032B0A|nr:PASTA domain-containing protein [Myroides phaeus]